MGWNKPVHDMFEWKNDRRERKKTKPNERQGEEYFHSPEQFEIQKKKKKKQLSVDCQRTHEKKTRSELTTVSLMLTFRDHSRE